jgi:hypothetical protein
MAKPLSGRLADDLRSSDRSVARTLIAFVVLAALTAPALAQKAERPALKAGDRWRFETKINGAAVKWLDRVWVVTSVTPLEIDGTENGKPLQLTPNLNNIQSPSRTDTDRRLLVFPLEIGKRWRFSNEYTVASIDVPSRSDYRVGVAGYEKVHVAAGDFDAFKLLAKGRWKAGGLSGQTTLTYWYAPAARAIVKIEAQDTVWGTRTRELAEYKLQP